MDFLYPKFIKPTHTLKSGSPNTEKYPNNISFFGNRAINVTSDTKVCLVRDNIGIDCAWSLVKFTEGNNQDRLLYVPTAQLASETGKQSYKPICSLENSIDETEPEIDPTVKEIFVPYIDRRNGLYSVRIQTEYEKILDSFLFDALLQDVFYEGVSVLLASRGIKSDNAYIDFLQNKFERFGYINNDLDLTVNRFCEPLTFTVSIPLNFFNEQEIVPTTAEIGEASKIVEFTNANFETIVSRIIDVLTVRSDDVQKLLYPNNFIENFVIDFEVASLKSFKIDFIEFSTTQNFSISQVDTLNAYQIGLDDSLNVVYIKLKNVVEEKTLSQPQLSAFRLKPSLNSKRIFNYILNLDEMSNDIRTMDIKEFIFKYVKYPDPKIIKDTIKINGKTLPADKAEQFIKDYTKGSEQCINLSDVTSISKSVANLASYYDPLYHIFIKEDIDNIQDYNTYKSFIDEGKSTEDALSGLKKKLDSTNSKPYRTKQAEETAKNRLLADVGGKLDEKKKEAEEANDKLLRIKKEAESIQQQTQQAGSEVGPPTEEQVKQKEALTSKAADLVKQQDELLNKQKAALEEASNLESQKDTIQKTSAEQLSNSGQLDQFIGGDPTQTELLQDAISKTTLKDELLGALNLTSPVNFSYKNSAGEIIQDEKQNVNLSALLYLLNRMNITEVLFKKLLCVLKGTDRNNPVIADILSRIPVEVINYFNYLNTVSKLKGTDYIRALETTGGPDIKIYCAENNGLVYFVKGLRKFVTTLERAGDIVFTVLPNIGKLSKPTSNPYQTFITNLTQNVIRTITSLLLDLVKEFLRSSCEDPVADLNNNNFRDPFATHYPVGGFGTSANSPNNSNPNIVKDNRSDVLERVYYNELQFGFDREYTVDLIGRLINDINCILTPAETVGLLRGEITEVVKTLIKNIIRAKYSAPPNDLSFLLTDEEKLKLFFRELGFTVDPQYLKAVDDAIVNHAEASTLCDDQTLKARDDLEKNKLPKELGTLDRQQQQRIKTAKKLFEKIQNGATDIEISPLCPEFTNDQVEEAKQRILNNYVNFTRNSFSNILSNFTQEARQAQDSYAEKRLLLRQKADGNIINSVDYYLYNTELGLNLIPAIDAQNLKIQISENPKTISYAYNFGFKGIAENYKDLAKTMVYRSPQNSFQFCPEPAFEINPEFESILNNNYIVVEFAGASGDFVFDDTQEGSTDLSRFYKDDYKKPDGLYLKSKKFFISISLNYDPDFLTAVDYDEVDIKFIYNDIDNKEFRILQRKFVEGEIYSGFISDNVLDAIDAVTDQVSDSEIYYLDEQSDYITSNEKTVVKAVNENTAAGKLVNINDGDDIYVLSKAVFDRIADNKTKQYIQDLYLTQFKKEIEKINQFEKFKKTAKQLDKLFENKTIINTESGIIRKEINVASGKYNTDSDSVQVEYKNYSKWSDITLNMLDNETLNSKNLLDPSVRIAFTPAKNTSYNPEYFKTKYDIESDFYSINKKSKLRYPGDDTSVEKVAEASKSEDYDIFYNSEGDKYKDLYVLMTRFDFPVDDRYRRCNVLPHYLNLEYLLEQAKAVKQGDLCDLENYNIDDLTKIILVELTFRVYVTDLLIKAIPYLSTMNENDLRSMYNKKTYVDIIREFIKQELKVFSPDFSSQATNTYYKYFSKITKDVYNKYKNSTDLNGNNKLNAKFVDDFSLEPEVDYFIKKEIYRTIKYCLAKQIFRPSQKSYLEKLFDKANFGISQPPSPVSQRQNDRFIFDLAVFEYESMLGYHLMANIVDSSKRSSFFSTKSELAKSFFSNISSLTTVEEADANIADNAIKREEDVIQFIQNLAYSPAPAAMVSLKPEYAKYVKTYLMLLLETTRNSLLTLAEATDLNISIARKINQISTFIAVTAFGFLDDETKVSTIISDYTLGAKRISDGRAPAPDWIMSWGVSTRGIFPGLSGVAYLLFDTIADEIYKSKAQEEVNQLIKSSAEAQKVDPCAITPEQKQDIAVNTTCSPESKTKLKKEINSLEET